MAVLVSIPASACGAPEERETTAVAGELPSTPDRLIAVARAWAKVKFHHPFLGYKEIDWDGALVAAIPTIEAARTVAEYRRAVDAMLARLGDAATRVVLIGPSPRSRPPAEWLTRPDPAVVAVDLRAFTAGTTFDFAGARNKAGEVSRAAANAKVLLVDLRGAPPGSDDRWRNELALDLLQDIMPAISIQPLVRQIEHQGFRSQETWGSGGYYSSFIAVSRPSTVPADKGDKVFRQVVFVVDPATVIPPMVWGLRASGRASVVGVGGQTLPAGETIEVDLGANLAARIRVGEVLVPGGTAVDARATDAGALTSAIAIARQLAARPFRDLPTRQLPEGPAYVPRDDPDYAQSPYPSRELRTLAAIKAWAVIDSFFPYRSLIADWDAAFRRALPAVAGAPDAAAYLRAMRELGVATGDGHVSIWRNNEDPRRPTPLTVRLVEDRPVVVALGDAAAVKPSGIRVGDEIVRIDGRPVADWRAELTPLVSASTAEARAQVVVDEMLRGTAGTSVKLEVVGADGVHRTTTLARLTARRSPRPAPHFRRIGADIGYADLTELTVDEVAPMFVELASTRGLILDMRGYPNGTAWAIAPHINVRKARHGALFFRPVIGPPSAWADRSAFRFFQVLPTADVPLYRGTIVVLIDDRAISQAEHSCLFFKEAAPVTFIGSPTHGANGDVTVLRLPGGLRMTFTGQEVRHVDGTQLQQVGIQPHIVVRPTLAGVRAGKDEVLERAIQRLRTGK
jgi:C-terminal processing protease CtpA/Prc